MLSERDKAKGGGDQRSDHPSQPASGGPQRLAELGISHTQSSRWQKLAAIPDRDFEATFAGTGARPTTTGLITAHQLKPAAPVTPVDPRALWLWGRMLASENAAQRGSTSAACLDAVAAISRVLAYNLLRWDEATFFEILKKVTVDYPSCRDRLEAGSGIGWECTISAG